MSDTTTPDERPTVQLIAALALHAVVCPWWLAIGALLGSGFVEDYGPAPAFAVMGSVLAVWVWLLVKLVQWWREGRSPLWSYPLRWVLVQGFIFVLLIPMVWRAMRPERVSGD